MHCVIANCWQNQLFSFSQPFCNFSTVYHPAICLNFMFCFCKLNWNRPMNNHIFMAAWLCPTTKGKPSLHTAAHFMPSSRCNCYSGKTCPFQHCQETVIHCLHPILNKKSQPVALTQLWESFIYLVLVGTGKSHNNITWRKLRQKKITDYTQLHLSPFSSSLDHMPLSRCALRICWQFTLLISMLSLHIFSLLCRNYVLHALHEMEPHCSKI